MKSGQIFWKSVYETNPRNESFENIKDLWSTIQNESGFVNHKTKWIFLESGFVTTIQNESMDLQNESTFLQISYTIPASLGMTYFQEHLWGQHFILYSTSVFLNIFSFAKPFRKKVLGEPICEKGRDRKGNDRLGWLILN
jgi:hypothetical protein